MFLQRTHLLWALPSSGRGGSNLFRKLFALLAFPITIAVLWALPRNAHAQILYVSQQISIGPPFGDVGIVSEFNAKTGEVIDANFITGLRVPRGLAVSGNTLFVADRGRNTVGKYDARTGAAINPGLITGLSPVGLALSGNTLLW